MARGKHWSCNGHVSGVICGPGRTGDSLIWNWGLREVQHWKWRRLLHDFYCPWRSSWGDHWFPLYFWPEHGFVGYSEELLFNNTLPDYSQGESFFTVFGVFFPAATGVMAGFNMSGDLQKPATNIPLGSLAAIGTSWFLYMVFVFLLGAICTRQSLRYDFMIAEKREEEVIHYTLNVQAPRFHQSQVSLVGILFLLGLYISSLASCMGGLYGAPRILQCIAQENVVPMLAFLGHGKGPNRTPVAAICLTSLITMAFVFIGQVNVLAPIVTINFMLTYIAVDYSYFSISLCYDDQQKAGKTQVENTKPHSSQPLIFNKPSSHASDGVIQSRSNGTLLEFTKDMDQLFKPFRNEPSASKKGAESLTQKVKQKKVKKPAKQTLQDSFLLDLDHDAPPAQYGWDETAESHHESWQDLTEQGHQLEVGPYWSPATDTQGTPELLEQGEQLRSQALALCSQKVEESSVRQQNLELGIQQIPESFYSRFCNHWVSFAGAIVSLIIMFVIQWIYTLVSLGAAVILYFYIGQVSPGLPLGAAANFSLFSWIKSALITSCRRRPSPKEQIVVTPAFATVGMETTQLTEENADFASRDRYHQSSLISREEFVNQFQ
ncbi:solute carrier family 12 member 8 isoform X5 [Cygnus atratus]|uniref:solute carrier family 12 member 8 isoform X5 n=1 Tax=Cygnus atratus TaxID=8868 RepID=UPI0015D5E2FF|nr:solute carrier family 12 member 8 isoform X5 [Cygnus atratus]